MVTGDHNSSFIHSIFFHAKRSRCERRRNARCHSRSQTPGKATDESATTRYGVIVEPTVQDSAQPSANNPDVVMPSPAQHTRDAFQGPVDTLRHRLAPELELPSPGRRAVVRKSQEVERLRPALPALLAIGRCKSAELHEPRLLGVHPHES